MALNAKNERQGCLLSKNKEMTKEQQYKQALEKIRDWNYGKTCCDIFKGFARNALKEIEGKKK